MRCGVTVTPARQKIGEFTQPYLPSGKVAITQSTAAQRFTSAEAINQTGVRVIENPGGTNEQFAARPCVVRRCLHRDLPAVDRLGPAGADPLESQA